jgi:hypothetical protein
MISSTFQAHEHGNPDATMRLSALSGSGESLSRQEHDSITETKLVRRRTLAAQKSENQPLSPPWGGNSFPPIKEAQSAPPNRDSNTVLEAIRRTSLAPPTHEPPLSEALPPLPPPLSTPAGGTPPSPPRPQFKRYALSDAPPTGPVRTSSPTRKLRKNHEHNSSSTSLANIIPPSARLVSGDGRAPSPGRTPRTKVSGDDMGPVPSTAQSQEVFNVPPPQSANGSGANTPTKRPTTFAEMGFHGVKAQDKECIIM